MRNISPSSPSSPMCSISFCSLFLFLLFYFLTRLPPFSFVPHSVPYPPLSLQPFGSGISQVGEESDRPLQLDSAGRARTRSEEGGVGGWGRRIWSTGSMQCKKDSDDAEYGSWGTVMRVGM